MNGDVGEANGHACGEGGASVIAPDRGRRVLGPNMYLRSVYAHENTMIRTWILNQEPKKYLQPPPPPAPMMVVVPPPEEMIIKC